MPIINGKACVVNGTPVEKAFSNGKQVYGRNILVGIDKAVHQAPGWFQWVADIPAKLIKVGQPLCFSAFINNAPYAESLIQNNAFCLIRALDLSGDKLSEQTGNAINFDADGITQATLIVPDKTDTISLFVVNYMKQNPYYGYPKVEFGSIATPWTPAPEDVLK